MKMQITSIFLQVQMPLQCLMKTSFQKFRQLSNLLILKPEHDIELSVCPVFRFLNLPRLVLLMLLLSI